MAEFVGTPKQLEILQLILKATDNSLVLSLRELWKTVSHGPSVTKQAILCSVRILESHGLLQRVYGKEHSPVHHQGKAQYLRPTTKTYQLLRRSAMSL